jgi:RimJ/RimL family protein N-acetyltransferase
MDSRLDDVAWPVRTERLRIRPAVVEDVDATWRYRRLDSVCRWMTTFPATRASYRSMMEDPERLAKTLVVERDGRDGPDGPDGPDSMVVGDLMLAVEDAWSQSEVAAQARGVQAEIGWCLDPAYAGQGLATEACEALVRICFETLGLRRLTANCFADNERSWRLMERLGMRREVHTVRESLHRSGLWLDGYGYALLADEWRASRDGDLSLGRTRPVPGSARA